MAFERLIKEFRIENDLCRFYAIPVICFEKWTHGFANVRDDSRNVPKLLRNAVAITVTASGSFSVYLN